MCGISGLFYFDPRRPAEEFTQLEQSLSWAERGALSEAQLAEILALYR